MSVERVTKLLNTMDRAATERILEYIGEQDPALEQEIRMSLFTFEDLRRLEDRDLRILLQEIPNPLLTIALKGADDRLVDKVAANMSGRVAEILREDLAMSGPKSRREVEAAQKTVTATARMLLDQGKIFAQWLEGGEKVIY